jgi:hypothetical protein
MDADTDQPALAEAETDFWKPFGCLAPALMSYVLGRYRAGNWQGRQVQGR